MRVLTIIFCAFLLVLINNLVSCTFPVSDNALASQLSSLIDRNDDDDDDDGDEFCHDRDSCQDSCDYIFHRSSARSQCYDLEFDEVNDLEEAFDVLSASIVNKRKLEDLDNDQFDLFLEMDVDSWIALITGDHVKRGAYSKVEIQDVLEWIGGEDADRARTILEYDEDSDILYTLFQRLGETQFPSNPPSELHFILNTESGDMRESILWENDGVTFCRGADCSNNTPHLKLSNSLSFLAGFIGISSSNPGKITNLVFDNDSFVIYADTEGNRDAVELAHISASRFCGDELNKDEDEEEVGQCLQAIYCGIASIESQSGYIGENSMTGSQRLDDIVFNAVDSLERFLRRNNCQYSRLIDEDNFD